MHNTTVLLILDGWGHREAREHNAIAQAHTPNWDKLWRDYPHTLLDASGHAVGLPDQQMGNSEVGHLNMGAGRLVRQALSRITQAIDDSSFQQNTAFTNAFQYAAANKRTVHIMGLLSPGGVHSHEDHIVAACELAEQCGVKQLALHLFLDGRDTAPKSAAASLKKIGHCFKRIGVGDVASICGRYYAMDRDTRWDRTQTCYDALTLRKASFQADTAESALEAAYARGETDEFVQATLIGNHQAIQDDDVIVMMNFRADRARQLTQAFTLPAFHGFPRERVIDYHHFVTLTEYAHDLPCTVAYPPEKISNTLAEVVSKQGLSQLHTAETEKYAHVTFFFNGGVEAPFPLEKRILVNSPDVATYDLQPEMHVAAVAQHVIDAIHSDEHALVICNFANADMVGHTGDFDATVKAIEAIDACLGEIHQAVLENQAHWFITADHGNAELMYNADHAQAHTAHTNCLVPFVYVGKPTPFTAQGTLCDIAPTLLHVMDLTQPNEMTGVSLLG
ncbi:MAG: 2,3-bisphosphoglycerate-independent phosphoglycerate mutase [marine bacterium B5-7]|nr:MAG: 2,3-bisphosphoglycerate-independent phosphoglycerate mutase [marine bacterium B5-7]